MEDIELGATGRSAAGDAPEVTYDIGGYGPEVPLVGSWRVKGALQLRKQLPQGAKVTVTVAGPDGEVVAIGEGHLAVIGFHEHDDKDLFWVERRHTAEIG